MKLSRLFKRVVKDNLLLLIRFAGYPLVLGINIYLQKKRLFILYRLHGSAIGDTFIMTGVVRCIAEELGCRVIVYVKQNENIFLNNSRILFCRSYEKMNRLEKTLVKNGLEILRGTNIAKFHPQMRNHENFLLTNRKHLIAVNSLHIPGLEYNNPHTEIFFSQDEFEKIKNKLALPCFYAIVKPTGKTSVTTKKEWGIENFQAVIDQFPEITWIQPGSPEDPLLNNVIDLRGKTDLRELFFLIANAKLILSIEGLYNHIAGAFSSPSVVVYSGFSYRELTAYSNTIPIVQDELPSCAPCFMDGLKDCPKQIKLCMNQLTPEQVVTKIQKILSQRLPPED